MPASPTPTSQHQWLQQLVGAWSFETEPMAEPGGEAKRYTGVEHVRSVGGIWTIAEGRITSPDGEGDAADDDLTVMTLGYDVERQRFVGTYIGTMMTELWVYDGELEADGRTLALYCEGPSFTTPGQRSPYKDTIEMVNPNQRILRSRYADDAGVWHAFMTMHYERSG